MQIKSWQISLVAIFIQILILVYLFYLYFKYFNPLLNNYFLNRVVSISAVILFVELIFISAITLSLKSNKMKKIGAIAGILYGIVILGIFRELFLKFLYDSWLYAAIQILDYLLAFGVIPALLLLIAGIRYLWKKV